MLTYWTEHTDLLGDITIQSDGEQLCALYWGCIAGEGHKSKTPLLAEAFLQLHDYLNGKRKQFSLPLCIEGTPFEQQVYHALIAIPYGKTVSYEDVAISVGRPRACRAVGMANHRNPLPIVVPCHRVVQKNGGLGGFAPGLRYKKALLDLEHDHAIR